MRSYWFHSPTWLQWFYPDFVWKIKTNEKAIFLTFDDGPDPVATEFVLEQLDRVSAKATFFCIGENIQNHPELFLKILNKGHAFGNHTFQHLNGWNTKKEVYLTDVRRFEDEIKRHAVQTHLFRPPYGRIKKSQATYLACHYQTVMWSHLAGDFDKNLHLTSAKRALLNAQSGSIFLFHDSFAAYNNLMELLPTVLDHYTNAGYNFKSLADALN